MTQGRRLQGAGPGLAGRRARAVLQGEDSVKIDYA
jgi:hypothetical protein